MSKKRRKQRAPTRGKKKAKRPKRTVSRSVRKKRSAPVKRATKKSPPRKSKATASVSKKIELRTSLRAKRNALTRDEQALAGKRLVANLATTRLFRVSRRIACYLPNDGEIDPSDVIERVWRLRKELYLPVLSRIGSDRLWFAPAHAGAERTTNRLGISEPRVHARELVRAEDLDLILMPLVAFDVRGNRLGRGAGFYDRSLAFLRHRRYLRKPHLLGIAHDFQRVAAVPVDAWDIPLDGIVTDRAVYYATS